MTHAKQSVTTHVHTLIVAVTVMLLGGCSTFSADGGFGAVGTAAKERGLTQNLKWVRTGKDAAAVRATVEKLLASPLTADAAAQIALINNRGLQATYAELGIAEADLVQAGRLTNPGFTFEHLTRGSELSIDRTFLVNVLGLITMPMRTNLQKQRFEITQARVTAETLQVATDARRAYYRTVATQESVNYMEQVNTAAEASAELARRMAAAGNFSKLDQAREQVFYAEVTAQLARVRHRALAERERLTRLMGLWGEDIRFKLPERLPDLPALPEATREIVDLEAQALKQRLDVQGAMQEAENIASALGLVKATGFINVLEVGYRRNSQTDQPRQSGYVIDLRLPIFDWGGARVARAEYTYMQAVNRAADTAIQARSEVREAYAAYRTTYDLARHYCDEIVPLRKRISEENLLRYNGMLISVFELLADARQQVASVNAYIEALRDYWLAASTLNLALTGKSPGAVRIGDGAPAAPSDAQPGH